MTSLSAMRWPRRRRPRLSGERALPPLGPAATPLGWEGKETASSPTIDEVNLMTMLIVAMLSIALPLFLIVLRVAVVVFSVVLRLLLWPTTMLVVLVFHTAKSLITRKR